MKKISLVIIIFWIWGTLAYADNIRILVPTPGSTILARRRIITVVLSTKDKKASQIRLKTSEGEISPKGIWEFFGTYYPHFLLRLNPGENNIVIKPYDKEFTIKYKVLQSLLLLNTNDSSVFSFHRYKVNPQPCAKCHTDRIPKGVKINPVLYGPFDPQCISCHQRLFPKGYSKHPPAANWLCRFCHEERGHIRIFAGKPLDLCTQCHVNAKHFYRKKHVHGPVATGDCTACHNPHAGPYPFELTASAHGQICTNCHRDKAVYLQRSPQIYVHGILVGLGCTACHDPHASDYRYQLHQGPINLWCTRCHLKLQGLKRGHPLKTHPLIGPKDPIRKGRKFGCTSCHNPHGSKYRFLLIGDVYGGHVCRKCHPY